MISQHPTNARVMMMIVYWSIVVRVLMDTVRLVRKYTTTNEMLKADLIDAVLHT